MSKKSKFDISKWGLNIGVIITLITFLIGGVSSYNRLQAKSEETSEKITIVGKKVEEIEKEGTKKVEEVKKENQEIEKNLTEMRVEQKYLQQSVIDLNNNVKELVQEIKEDRKKKK